MATTLGAGPKTIEQCEGIAQFPVVDVDRDPRCSPTTLAVLFAVAAGYRWGCPKPYLDLVEELKGGTLQRRVHWTFDGGSTVEIDGRPVEMPDFWRALHAPSGDLPPGSVVQRLRQALEVLEGVNAADRADTLERFTAVPSLSGQVAAICAKAAEIYRQFRADRLPRFLLIQQARGREIHRCYIPFHATPEERARILAAAGMS